MDTYRYKTEKQGPLPGKLTVKFSSECEADNEYLLTVISMVKGREFLRREVEELSDMATTLEKRVSDTQSKMHKATTELAKMKKSWVYKVVNFIHYIFDAGRGKG